MKGAIYILICSILGILIVMALFARSTSTSKIKNNFQRSFLSLDPLNSIQVLNLKHNGYYFAGLSENQIYLGNFVVTDKLLVIDHSLTKILYLLTNIPDTTNFSNNIKLKLKSLKITVDSPRIFIYDKINANLFNGDMSELHYKHYDLSNLTFNKFVSISTSTFVLSTYDPKIKQNTLLKIDTNLPSLKEASFALTKQVDGIFSTEGTLLYNHYLSQIIYVYLYRNQYVSLDTRLNVLYQGNTIDTISHANIKIQRVPSENRTVLTSNPVKVNQYCTVYENWLYIRSGLLADNEPKGKFEQNSVIDVYSLKNQHYQFSFYLPDFKDEKMLEFKVFGNKILALYNHYLISYQFDSKGFSKKLTFYP